LSQDHLKVSYVQEQQQSRVFGSYTQLTITNDEIVLNNSGMQLGTYSQPTAQQLLNETGMLQEHLAKLNRHVS
jgi:hypothetical protein